MGRRARRLANVMSEVIPSNCRVLDVGSGNGRLSEEILSRRSDLAIQGLEVLEWPEQRIATELFDGVSIPYDDASWDICMASDVLHHSKNPMLLLSEMARVARTGLVVKDHVADSRFDQVLLSLLDWAGNRGYGIENTYEYWSWTRWVDAFSSLGLDMVQKHSSLSLYPIPVTWILDRNLHFVVHLNKRDTD